MADPKWCSHCGAQHTSAEALCEQCKASGVVAPQAAAQKPARVEAALPAAGAGPSKTGLVVGAIVGGCILAAVGIIWSQSGAQPAATAPGAPESQAVPARGFEELAAADPGPGPSVAPFRESAEAPPAEGIAGEYWRDTEPEGRPRKMSLCPDGRYFEYEQEVGRWTATGLDEGKISLAFSSGKASELTFRILREPRFCSKAGCDAEFSGSRYGRDPTLGNCAAQR